VGVQARRAIIPRIFDKVGMDMNRVILLESLLALAAVAVLGPGTSVLVQQAARQALAMARTKVGHRTVH
jgi:hypothetical protein